MKLISEQEKKFAAARAKGLSGVESAKAAGYANPKLSAHRLGKRKRVKDAIAEISKAANKVVGKKYGHELSKVTITRNEIINILAARARNAKSESASVTAAMGLADIFRLRPKNANETENFDGWTTDECLTWAQSGIYPARFRRKSEPSEGVLGGPESSKSPIN